MLSEIEYREIPGVSTKYKAGSDGNIYSFVKGMPNKLSSRIAKGCKYTNNSVVLLDGRRVTIDTHKMVCAAFHGEKPTDKHVVAHNDGNRENNRPENLRWDLQFRNLHDRFIHGTHDSGTANSRAVLDDGKLFVCRWLLNNIDLTHTEIGSILACTRETVTKINVGKRYHNINVYVKSEVISDILDKYS